MKDTWFIIGFLLLLVRDRIIKRGSELVAWPFFELALELLHTCSRSTQDLLWNSKKHLEAERIEVRNKSKSEKQKQKNYSGVG